MTMSDPVADMLTRIRNAMQRQHPSVRCPVSRIRLEIARVMHEQGFITNWAREEGEKFPQLRVDLKYDTQGRSVIRGLRRVSRPGLRQHIGFRALVPVHRGQGVAILTTSQGVFSDVECRQKGIGGEILCQVW